MLSNLSELVGISTFLQNWNGRQNSKIKTSNTNLRNYYENGIDSQINIVILKILIQYDYEAFVTALENGLSLIYQASIIIMNIEDGLITCQIFGKNGIFTGLAKIDDVNINFIQIPIARDSSWAVIELFRFNRFGTKRNHNL